MDKLLPCPFCGGEADVMECEKYKFYVCCKKDCVEMPNDVDTYFTSEANAIKSWNTRPEPKGEVGEIVKALKHLKSYLWKMECRITISDREYFLKSIDQALSHLKPTQDVEERVIDYEGCTVKFLEDMNKNEELAYDLGYNHAVHKHCQVKESQ